jgi:hypothetical protein
MNATAVPSSKTTRMKAAVSAATSKLEELQYKQLRHDEIYHADICLLRIQARIAHHTLHLGKYAGKMAEALVAKHGVDTDSLTKTVLDALIIVMSASNTLNLALWHVEGAHDDLIGALAGMQVDGDPQVHVIGFTIIMGKLAKAVEALDHVEAMDSRTAYEKGLTPLWRLLLQFWRVLSKTALDDALKARLSGIELKNNFYARLPNYDNGYRPAPRTDRP